MDAIPQSTPVIYLNPFTGNVDAMPIEMIAAYLPYATHLNLEQAARVATIRDEEAATNLFEDVAVHYSVCSAEGCGYDELSVEPPSLR